MPIVGSYNKSEGSLSHPAQIRFMSSSRQKRPFVRAAFRKTWASAASKWQFGRAIAARNNAYNLTEPYGTYSDFTNSVRATAYTRLMGKALPQAAMLVNMAQGVQTWEMVAARTLQLVRAFKYLRRGKLGSFAAELSLDPNLVRRKVTHKRAIQDPQGAWLEFTFGWSPFIGDIYNAIDVLQTQFPTVPIRGSATATEAIERSNSYGWRRNAVRKVQARLVADLVITNPNLLLANQLGLLNPAAVVWDVIPFSFVVDWFLPVGKFIKTFNDQAGIKLLGQCTTLKHWVSNNERDSGFWSGENFATATTRIVGPFVKPGFPTKLQLPTASLWLATTSVALALQVFGGKK